MVDDQHSSPSLEAAYNAIEGPPQNDDDEHSGPSQTFLPSQLVDSQTIFSSESQGQSQGEGNCSVTDYIATQDEFATQNNATQDSIADNIDAGADAETSASGIATSASTSESPSRSALGL
eukprot:SAG11_NODE_12326_length_709_cov_0.696721_1_plen_119_part_10